MNLSEIDRTTTDMKSNEALRVEALRAGSRSASVETAMAAIGSIDLSAVKRKVVDEKGWSEEIADYAELRYRRFLCMHLLNARLLLVPPPDIDAFWHQHICSRGNMQGTVRRRLENFSITTLLREPRTKPVSCNEDSWRPPGFMPMSSEKTISRWSRKAYPRVGWNCLTRRGAARCTNSRSIARTRLEERILAGLKDRMMAPERAPRKPCARTLRRRTVSTASAAQAAKAGARRQGGAHESHVSTRATNSPCSFSLWIAAEQP